MLILPDFGHPYLIDNVSGPVIPKFNWFYDSETNDFMLKPIRLLEETTGPTVRVMINRFQFDVPASWNLLVVDEETKLIDTVPITQCASSNFQAFLMHPETFDYHVSPVTLLDFFMKESCVHVMIPRMHMLVHPVGPIEKGGTSTRSARDDLSYSCLLSPQDLGKYMQGMTAMEVVL